MQLSARTLSIAAIVLGGCQLFVSSDVVQCATDGDCAGRGEGFEGSVCVESYCIRGGDRCIGKVQEALEDRMQPRHLRMRYADVGGNAMKDVEVLVCANLDEECATPIGAPVRTDLGGYAYLTVWKNFKGTVQVKHPPTTNDYLKSKLHFLGAYDQDDSPTREIPIDESVRLITRTLLQLQLGTRGTIDPNAGHLIASVMDCDLKTREGVSVSIATANPGDPVLFYFTDNGLVSSDSMETPLNGRFGVVNAPAGQMTLDATIVKTGQRLGRVQVFVNKDTISNFAIMPTP